MAANKGKSELLTAGDDRDFRRGYRTLVLSDFGLENYGNRLQSYAVLSILRDYGISGVVACQVDGVFGWLIKDAAKCTIPSALWPKKLRYRRFRQFAKRHTPYKLVEFDRLYEFADSFDCVIVGSDQVWSPTIIARLKDPLIFFLVDLRPEKKIALSPSFGLIDVPKELTHVYSKGLLSFPKVSVREETGASIVRRVSGQEAVVLADPTIAVSVDEWKSIADYSICPDRDYVLTYYLGDGLECITEAVAEYAASNSLEIINLMDKDDRFYDSGPAEFIGLIDRASYVVTDSFHGSVFSLLLHTPFSVIRRTDTIGSEMFSRIETLANKFECWDRVVDDKDYRLADVPMDWEAIDRCVVNERDAILDYMTEELVRCGLV